jgi:hypothetical protein
VAHVPTTYVHTFRARVKAPCMPTCPLLPFCPHASCTAMAHDGVGSWRHGYACVRTYIVQYCRPWLHTNAKGRAYPSQQRSMMDLCMDALLLCLLHTAHSLKFLGRNRLCPSDRACCLYACIEVELCSSQLDRCSRPRPTGRCGLASGHSPQACAS